MKSYCKFLTKVLFDSGWKEVKGHACVRGLPLLGYGGEEEGFCTSTSTHTQPSNNNVLANTCHTQTETYCWELFTKRKYHVTVIIKCVCISGGYVQGYSW